MHIFSCWMVFLFLWGFVGRIVFDPTGLFGARWWFNSLGHAVAGMLIVVTCLDSFFGRVARFGTRESTFVSVISALLAWALIWEGLEAVARFAGNMWNEPFFVSVGGAVDTGSDIVVALTAGWITWWWGKAKTKQTQPAAMQAPE